MGQTTKNILKIILFLLVGVTILYLVYYQNNQAFLEECAREGIPPEECSFIDKILGDVRSANYLWVLLAVGIYLLSNLARALRWGMLIEPLGHKPALRNTFLTVMITHLVNLGIPRSGEFVRAGLLSRYEGLRADQVMGTIVTSRIIDMVSLAITIFLTVILASGTFLGYFEDSDLLQSQDGSLGITSIIILLGVAGLVVLGLIYVLRDRILATSIGQRIWNVIKNFGEGILSVRRLRQPGLFVFYSIVIWVCYFLMTYMMFFSFEPTAGLPPTAGLVTFVFGTLGIVIPSPGGMGTYQFLITEALQLYTIPFAEAFSFANIMFFSIQLCNVVIGFLSFVLLPIVNRK